MLTPEIFSPSVASFITILAFVVALAVLWIIVRFVLKLTRVIFTVGCLSLLALAALFVLSAFAGR